MKKSTEPIKKGATVRGRYRFELWRIWDESLPMILFIGVNPSTADGQKDDPTIRKLIGFTKRFGYGGFYIGNLSPIISSNTVDYNPSVNDLNYKYIKGMAARADIKVVMWGNGCSNCPEHLPGMYTGGAYCFGKTLVGNPKHPVRLPYTTNLIPYDEANTNMPIIQPTNNDKI